MSPDPARSSAPSHRRVVILTGNEKQARLCTPLSAQISEQAGDQIDVVLICPSYARNWSKPLAEFSRELDHADAAVIGTYLPTELGKAARSDPLGG